MYGYIYKITNKLNNKVYVGKRVSETFDEKYWGSGKAIKNSILKYGLDNFTRDILEWCSSDEELNDREKYWIKELKANQKQYGYNFTDGGTGGNTIKYLSEEEKEVRLEKISKTKANYSDEQKEELHNKLSKALSAAQKKLYENGYENNNKGRKWYTNGTEDKMCFECPEGYWLGRSHNNIDYEKVSKSLTGKVIYNNGINEKFFRQDDIIPEGWTIGRLPGVSKKQAEKIRGRVPYNNGKIEIRCLPGTEPAGFIKGVLPATIEKMVQTRRESGTYIKTEETKNKLSYSTSKLWEDKNYREQQSNAHKNKKLMHKGEVEKQVNINEVDMYLQDGWEFGWKPSHKTSKGKIRNG